MSCYFVAKETIDLLVSAAVELKIYAPLRDGKFCAVTEQTADLLGQLLWTQNAASVNCRYPDARHDDSARAMLDSAAAYRWQPYIDIKPAAVVGCARNLDYQACETQDYNGSATHLFCLTIQAEMAKKLVGETIWGVDAESIGKHARAVFRPGMSRAPVAGEPIRLSDIAKTAKPAAAPKAETKAPAQTAPARSTLAAQLLEAIQPAPKAETAPKAAAKAPKAKAKAEPKAKAAAAPKATVADLAAFRKRHQARLRANAR